MLKIALFDNNMIMREITKTAAPNTHTIWAEYSYLSEQAIEAFEQTKFDAIVTSKVFSEGDLSSIIDCARASTLNKETPVFLFTSDTGKSCIDEFFELGVTDVFNKRELPLLADTLSKIETFSESVAGAHVLMLEDNEFVSEHYADLLSDLKCTVHQTKTCDEAESILKQYPIELLITDLNLEEGGQGQRIIRSMRRNENVVLNNIPIMVMSCCITSQVQTCLFFLGIDEYIVKPALPLQFSLRAVNLIKKFRTYERSEKQAVELKQIAHFDKLTKVYNRCGFEDLAKFCVANLQRQVESVIGIMYIDLDNFKPVNDELGHAAGDKVLVKIAEILKVELREQDIVARWGGDEFIVLLNQCDIRFVQAVCDRVTKKIKDCANELCNVGVSIGTAYGEPTNYEELLNYIASADADMYSKKSKNKRLER